MILTCENIGMRYGMGPEVLRDVNLEIEEGDFCILTGPSGAGKTTLLQLLYLALNPTRGLLSLFGEEPSLLNAEARALMRRRIGVVFQDFRLLDHLTLYENVTLPLHVSGQSDRKIRRDMLELIGWAGLKGLEDAYPPTLSGGEKQRAAIIRALATRPALLLADEPTGSVDPEIGERLIHLFAEVARQGSAVLIATHTPSLAAAYPARLLKLDQGELFAMPSYSSTHAPSPQMTGGQ